jgi:tetratricopeptide (TPR) repeat protein
MRRLFTYSLLLFTVLSFAQAKKDKALSTGNDQFIDNDYVDAEASYRISGSNSPTKSSSAYNLGNAIYRQNQNAEAAYAYGKAIKNATTKQQKHMAYHNLGNVMMKEKDYQGAVEAYKNALRNDPTDDKTRYNLALAKEMLKNNPPPPPKPDDKKDKKDNKDNKDQKKDNKSQQPNKPDDKKGNGDKDNKDKGKDDSKDKKGDQKDKGDKGEPEDKQNNGEPKPEAGQNPSKQRMENLLDAMNNEEKKVQDKIQGKRVRVRPGQRQEKDW